MFNHVPSYPGDPVLSLNQDFNADTRTPKVNLSIGMYFDESGRIPVLRSVGSAKNELRAGHGPHPYLPMAGLADYRTQVQQIVFGPALADRLRDRIATIQTLGGSGALKVGADFLKQYFPSSKIYMSDPTWDNHRVLFEGAGFEVNHYPYYDWTTGDLRFSDMCQTLSTIPEQSVVVLHACCHNPTGVDLNDEDWTQLASVLRKGNLIAFVDMAYQGFGDGLKEDAAGVRKLVEAHVPVLIANSFSKNFSLYGERCGALSVICDSSNEKDHVLGQLCAKIRANYSNPPAFGATIIARVLGDPALAQDWMKELKEMRDRMHRMRSSLYSRLEGKISEEARARYIRQRGMFSYTGMTKDQVVRLRNEFAIYLVESGRLCVAGLNDGNVDYVASSIASVVAG
ncbi:aspartate/tyrosine/aromatic aminotransferase [Paraburkholderia fungorum]|uniref:amino acid aminotransferase n=1 Tax=Paraburkholderia fungorum TaxID=134537 RepID=UPI0038B8D8D9